MTDWKTVKLKEIADITRGGSPRPIEQYITKEEGYNWLRIGDVPKDGKYISKVSAKIKPEGLSKTTLVHKGDFILSNSMSYGRPYITMVDTCIHDGWLALRNLNTQLIDRNYLYYLLLHPLTQYKFSAMSAGSGVQNLKKETVNEIEVKIPSVSEQKRIVSLVESWDVYLEKLDKKIELKKNIKKGLMQQLLTGKKRLGNFGKEWKEIKIGDVANISKGRALSSSSLVKGTVPVIAGGKSSPYSHNQHTHEDVVTVSASGAYAGYVSHHPYKIWASDCSVVTGDNINSDTGFLYHILKMLQQKIYSLQSGGAQPHIYPKDLETIKIMLPDLDEQQAIAEVLTLADREINLLLNKRKKIAQQKLFLLNELVSGKIRTPENLTMPAKEVQYA